MNQLTTSFWSDEAFTAAMIQNNPWQILTLTSQDTSPPFYYLLLHVWSGIFGLSEVSLRSFSVILFLMLAFVVFAFVKEVFSKKAAFFAAALTLVNPILFLYAFEARMYMLVVLLGTTSMWFFVTKRWKLYVLVTLAALYTQYFAVFLLAAQVLYYGIDESFEYFQSKKRSFLSLFKKQTKSPFLISILIVLLGYLPWIPSFLTQTTNVTGDFWLSKPSSIRELRYLFEHFLVGNIKLPQEQIILSISVFLLIYRGFKKRIDALLYLWLLFPPIVTFLYSMIGKPLYFDRYLILCIPPLPMLLATQSDKLLLPKSLKHVNNFIQKIHLASILLSILIVCMILINIHTFTHPTKEPFQKLSSYIFKNYGKNAEVINYYTNNLHYHELKYTGVNVKIYTTRPIAFWWGKVLIDDKNVLTVVPQNKKLLVVASGELERINLPGYQEVERKQFKNLYLLVFEKTSDE